MAENTAGPLRIVQLYPRDMNIYGDWGNTLTLKRRAERYGLDTEIVDYDPGDPWPEHADLFVGGGGQDSGQLRVAEDLAAVAPRLHEAVERG
ncbi:MAG TPA: glutamine amidotransferase, partial [Kocuria sp.]|nr:glutamine amidotransferase [Kocuria sp.]